MKYNSFYQDFIRKRNAFTLIELLVVIAIIGLLASIILVSVNSVRKKTRDTKRLAEMDNIIKAIEMYNIDKGAYPGSGDTGGIHLSPECSSDLKNDLINNGYFSQVPADPLDGDTGCSNNSDGAFYYGWDSSHCCEGSYCISINTLETDWVKDRLIERFGDLHYVTGGGDANIGTGDDFNYCFVKN